MKTCSICRSDTPDDLFTKDNRRRLGRSSVCRKCTGAKKKAAHRRRMDAITPEQRELIRAAKNVSHQRYIAENFDRVHANRLARRLAARIEAPERKRAQLAAQRAVQRGVLVRAPCERCAAQVAQAHHEDYSKPLDVVWLCRRCHAARHAELRSA